MRRPVFLRRASTLSDTRDAAAKLAAGKSLAWRRANVPWCFCLYRHHESLSVSLAEISTRTGHRLPAVCTVESIVHGQKIEGCSALTVWRLFAGREPCADAADFDLERDGGSFSAGTLPIGDRVAPPTYCCIGRAIHVSHRLAAGTVGNRPSPLRSLGALHGGHARAKPPFASAVGRSDAGSVGLFIGGPFGVRSGLVKAAADRSALRRDQGENNFDPGAVAAALEHCRHSLARSLLHRIARQGLHSAS